VTTVDPDGRSKIVHDFLVVCRRAGERVAGEHVDMFGVIFVEILVALFNSGY